MPGNHHLFVPGPTNIPERILNAMHRPSEDHRSVDFPHLVLPLLTQVARLFDTSTGRVAMFPSSGTGGWEAALTNLIPPSSEVLLAGAGQFATLWAGAATRLGMRVASLEGVGWGDAPDPDRLSARLQDDREHRIRAVLIVHNETSTGVTVDLPTIRRAIDRAGHPAFLLVDGVSSIGSLPYHHDRWGVDVAITGSQKGLMLPAGLALMAMSTRALDHLEHGGPRAYFDLRPMLQQNGEGYFPYTPPLPMLYGLRASLAMLFEEGLDQVATRHRRLATGVRAAVAAWGLRICCREPGNASDTVTTVRTPDGVDARALIVCAFRTYHLSLGAGLGPLAGRAFRIGHVGWLNEGMVLGALALIEMTLLDLGVSLEPGCGVAAAQRCWRTVAASRPASAANAHRQ